MATSLKMCLVGVIMCLAMIGGRREAEAVVSCNAVVTDLMPCLAYVTGSQALGRECCNGVITVYKAAQTTQDRRSVCQCLKSLVNSGAGVSPHTATLAAGLPDQCGVHLSYKISPSTDCNTVP